MPDKNFVKLVKDMRTAQKSYFKTRSTGALELSKSLEKQVDDYVKEATALQIPLF